MFDGRADDVAAVSFTGLANPANSQVVRLGAAGCKDNLVCSSAHQRSYLTPRAIDRRPSFLAKHMNAGSVAKMLGKEGHHRRDDALVDRRGGAVIEVNSSHRDK